VTRAANDCREICLRLLNPEPVSDASERSLREELLIKVIVNLAWFENRFYRSNRRGIVRAHTDRVGAECLSDQLDQVIIRGVSQPSISMKHSGNHPTYGVSHSKKHTRSKSILDCFLTQKREVFGTNRGIVGRNVSNDLYVIASTRSKFRKILMSKHMLESTIVRDTLPVRKIKEFPTETSAQLSGLARGKVAVPKRPPKAYFFLPAEAYRGMFLQLAVNPGGARLLSPHPEQKICLAVHVVAIVSVRNGLGKPAFPSSTRGG